MKTILIIVASIFATTGTIAVIKNQNVGHQYDGTYFTIHPTIGPAFVILNGNAITTHLMQGTTVNMNGITQGDGYIMDRTANIRYIVGSDGSFEADALISIPYKKITDRTDIQGAELWNSIKKINP